MKIDVKNREYRLNDGYKIPSLGFGTYKLLPSRECIKVVGEALKCGYRLIDCASAYDNESSVGLALAETTIKRDELFVTGKVWYAQRSYDGALRSVDESLNDLKLDYLDLYLIHWPAVEREFDDWKKRNSETWRALERMKEEGIVRSIGVSNFMPHHLEPLLNSANILPAVNQIEFNPGCQQKGCVNFCRENNILVQAWSPLGRGRIFNSPLIKEIAVAHNRSVAQICLRWEVQKGIVPVPKTSSLQRMKEDLDVFSFNLTDAEILAIDALPEFGVSGLNPDTNPPR